MKNNKLLTTILIVSIIVFAGLIFSIYKITSKKSTVFYTNGYVSTADSENSQKVYFDDNTNYKNGYNNQIIFTDKEGNKQEVSKFSFVFYNNGSISFLSNGVILDLNGLFGNFIPYYNILSNYIIENTAGKYVIHSNEKDIILDNFIGRISDQKYLVAGNNIKLKLSSSEDYILGSYFELNFIDGENVKIDGKDINIETISSESYILVNDNIKIDLASRKVLVNNEVKLDLSEIIIDNDSNIDIMYDDIFTENKTDDNTNKTKDNKNGNGEGNNISGNDTNNTEVNNTNSNSTENSNNNTKEGNQTDPNEIKEKEQYPIPKVTEFKSIPYVEFLSSYVSNQKINLEFKVIDENKLIQNNQVIVRLIKLNDPDAKSQDVVYTTSGNTINYIADSLQSNATYLVTILTSYIRDNVVFSDYVLFQRTFTTSEIGIKLERDYLDSTSIGYKIISSEDSEYTSAVLNVYNKDNELVSSSEFTNNHGEQIIVANGLSTNTKYTARIEDVTYGYVSNIGVLTSRSDTTLKYNPFTDSLFVNQPTVTVNKGDSKYKIDLGTLNDPDNAIKSVRYEIYEKYFEELSNETETLNDSEFYADKLVKTIKKDNVNSFSTAFDDEVKTHNKYYVKTYVSLNDNEKSIDYELLNSNLFGSDAKQSPTMSFTTDKVSTTSIDGRILVLDPDNSIDYTKDIYIEYVDVDGNNGIINLALSNDYCEEGTPEKIKCAAVNIKNLNPNDVYTLSLFGYVDLDDEELTPGNMLIGAIKVNTNEAVEIRTYFNKINALTDDLSDEDKLIILSRLSENLFEVDFELLLDLTLEKNIATMNNMKSFDLYLYEGKDINNKLPIGKTTITEDIANKYFDQSVINPDQGFARPVLTISTFNTTVKKYQNSKAAINSQISSDYTILITNGMSGDNDVVFNEATYHFTIEDALLDFITSNAWVDMEIIPNTINNPSVLARFNNSYDKTLAKDVAIGLQLKPEYDNSDYAQNIYYKIYDVTDRQDYDQLGNVIYVNKDEIINGDYPNVSFKYVIEDNSVQPSLNIWFPKQDDTEFDYTKLFSKSLFKNQSLIKDFTLENYGNTNITEQNFFRRGRVYFATIRVGIDDGNGGEHLIPDDGENCGKNPGELKVYKQEPKAKIYPYESSLTSDGVNYENGTIVYKYLTNFNETVSGYQAPSDPDGTLNNENFALSYTVGKYDYLASTVLASSKYDCSDSTGYKCSKISGLEDQTDYSILLSAKLLERQSEKNTPILLGTYTYEEYKSNLNLSYEVVKEGDRNAFNNIFLIRLNEEENQTELKKVAYYNVEISDDNGPKYLISNITGYPSNPSGGTKYYNSISIKSYDEDNKVWTLSKANDNESNKPLYYTAYLDDCDENKCIYIDFSKLYLSDTFGEHFKTFMDKNLYFNVSAVYDNGRIAYSHCNNKKEMGCNNQYGYTFQVNTPQEIDSLNEGYYISSNNSGNMYYNPTNLNISYIYKYDYSNGKYGFVEPVKGDNQITLINNLYTKSDGDNYSSFDYTITTNGIKLNNNYVVAKAMSKANLVIAEGKDNISKFDSVVPTISIRQDIKPTFDGAKFQFNVTGFDKTTLSDDIYLEIHNKDSEVVKTVKVDYDTITNFVKEVSVTDANQTVMLGNVNNDYHIDISKIVQKGVDNTGISTEKYSYNYKTGELKFKNIITNDYLIYYYIDIDGLESNTEYILKAYAKKKNSDKKVYFAVDYNVGNRFYMEYFKEFKTIALDENNIISNAEFSIESAKDYSKRTITLSYDIKDVIGTTNDNYNLVNDVGGNYTLTTTGTSDSSNKYKYIIDDNCYYASNTTCYKKLGNETYRAYVKFDVYDHSDNKSTDYLNGGNDLVYGTNYNISIGSTNIPSLNNVYLRELENPVINVDKRSYHNSENGYYLTYVLSINDPDRVILNKKYSTQLDYFSIEGNHTSALPKEIGQLNTDGVYIDNNGVFTDLSPDTGYYYTVKYQTYRNNKSLSDGIIDNRESSLNKRFLNYTISSEGFSLGIHQFTIEDDPNDSHKVNAYLKFGYTTNFVQDENDENQEKYLVGMHYIINQIEEESITTGNYRDLIFNSDNFKKVENNSASSSQLGAQYYQVSFDTSTLKLSSTTTYKINYQMWYAYNNVSISKEECNNPTENYWDESKNQCYFLSNSSNSYYDITNYIPYASKGGAK